MARGGPLPSGDPFGWREPVPPAGPCQAAGHRPSEGLARRWRPDRPRLRPGAAPRGPPRRSGPARWPSSGRIEEVPPPGAATIIERSLNGGFVGPTDSPSSPIASCSGPSASAAKGPSGGSSARHPRATDTRRPRRPHRSRRGPLRADAPAWRRRRGPRLPRAVLRWRRPDLRAGRADPDGSAGTAANGSQLRKLGGTSGCAPSSASQGRWTDLAEEAPRALRLAGRARGHAFAPRHAVAGRRWRPRSRMRRPSTSSARRRGEAGHGGRPADGPARRRRRRLRQDRSRAAGRVQGDPGWQAGRGPRADDRARRPAPRHVLAAPSGIPDQSPAPLAVRACQRRRRGRSPVWPPGQSTSSWGHIGCSPKGRSVPRPRPRRRRRGAALRGGRQGAPQAAPERGGRAHPVRNADPADAQPRARRDPRPERHRDAARRIGCRSRHASRRRPPAWSATRSYGRTRPGRPGLLRPQPGRDDRGADERFGGCSPVCGSWWATARCPRAPSRRS